MKNTAPSSAILWTGRVLQALVVLFLLFDAVGKFAKPAPVADAFRRLAFPLDLAPELGAILLGCTLLYAIPRTAGLGAVLLTGYLGGAIAINLRAGDPPFETWGFPILMGALAWAALALRRPQLKQLLFS